MPLEPTDFYIDIDKVPLSSLPQVAQEPFTHHAAIGAGIGLSAAIIAYLGAIGCIWLTHRWRYLRLVKESAIHAKEMQPGLLTEPVARVEKSYIQQASITIWAASGMLTRDVVRCLDHLTEVVKAHPFPDSNIDGQLRELFNGDIQYTLALKPCIDSPDNLSSFFSCLRPSPEFLLPHSSPGRYFILKFQRASRPSAHPLALSMKAAGSRIAEGEIEGTYYGDKGCYSFRVEPAPYRK